MSVSEDTYYNLKTLHKAFAFSAVMLLLATVVVITVDHRREWKRIQRTGDKIQSDRARWLQAQQIAAGTESDTDQLDQLLAEKRSSFFEFDGILPKLGKKWLELPIIDAFNSPRKIENLWHAGLDQEFGSFGRVLRYDRCTTCHQLIEETRADSADAPAFPQATSLDISVEIPDEALKSFLWKANGSLQPEDFARTFLGIQLLPEGTVSPDDVTITFVHPDSPAAQFAVVQPAPLPQTAQAIREQLLQTVGPRTHSDHVAPGLMFGDVITAINGQPIPPGARGKTKVLKSLWADAKKQVQSDGHDDEPREPLRLTVRRGLSNPFAGHPRLDLFVGSSSPHKMADFACTVCHEGQGSATSFKWASHSPNSPSESEQWWQQYGWFDNHDWQFPMWPRRFIQSACVKCHFDVTELAHNERYSDPPAPQLVRGFQRIQSLGCFGCHEINGFDDEYQRIGPDLRLEPNYSAVAQQLKNVIGTAYDQLTDRERRSLDTLISDPSDDSARRTVLQMIQDDQQLPPSSTDELGSAQNEPSDSRFSDYVHDTLTPLLKNHATPGTMRKVGPSLRSISQKLDKEFLIDWIGNPSRVLPTTQMPHSFGQWDHLPSQSILTKRHELERRIAELPGDAANRRQQLEVQLRELTSELDANNVAERQFEPIEILSIATYLLERSQKVDDVNQATYATPVTTDEETQAQIARGRTAFEQRGCLACHAHRGFPDIEKYRERGALGDGPDLSETAVKFAADRNPTGTDWLYRWIKQPTQFDPRTVMPDLYLAPIRHPETDGNSPFISDPVADIVAYLMSVPGNELTASDEQLLNLDEERSAILEQLTIEHLQTAYSKPLAIEYAKHGIPADHASQVQGAETELLLATNETPASSLAALDHRRLMYVGRRSLVRYGCFGCHDIPGLENAQPIGPELSSWGRQDPTKLAFNDILNYLHSETRSSGSRDTDHSDNSRTDSGTDDAFAPEYYRDQLRSHSRIGFAFQKLTEPRSFDYGETTSKSYTERLRMPKFSLAPKEREEILTFVLGLVADPPKARYVYAADSRSQAINGGQRVIDKFNCRACHLFELEKWYIGFEPEFFGDQDTRPIYPFIASHFTIAEQIKSRHVTPDGLRHAVIEGMPATSDDGLPLVFDEEDFPIEEEPNEIFSPSTLNYAFNLWRPTLLDGSAYQVGEAPINILTEQIQRRSKSRGGMLAKYLMPRVVAQQRELISDSKGAEAWGWLPPALVNEGEIVRTDWLFNFLSQPYEIRPAVTMRMPRFNMSKHEVRQLVDYFAALSRSDFPYHLEETRHPDHLANAADRYLRRSADTLVLNDGQSKKTAEGRYLTDAMRILTNENYCVTCHVIDDFRPKGLPETLAPDLADVYRRLRTDYVRRWIARPSSIQPYTSMPVNVSYDPDAPFLGSEVPQNLFPGTSIDQVEALVDLLMNFDRYAREHTIISKEQ